MSKRSFFLCVSCLRIQETGEEFQVLSQFQSIYEVTCALPPSRVQPEESVEVETEPVDHLSVRVTVDGRVFSDALAYSSFDSVCYDCPEAGSCVRKVNSKVGRNIRLLIISRRIIRV